MHEDAPSVALWTGGLRVVATHPNGNQVQTDMPTQLGGGGEHTTAGWLLRSALAACLATTIVMTAAQKGITLDRVEVRAASRSDARGLLDVAGADGEAVNPGPQDLRLEVVIAAAGVPAEQLRSLVEEADRRSAVAAAVRNGLMLPVRIELA